MAQEKELRPEGLQRVVSLDTVKYFWDLMSQHFPDLLIDLSLFNYKTGQFNKPKVKYGVRQFIPVAEAYNHVFDLLDFYHKGEDILWKPSDYYKDHPEALLSLVWLDDFVFDKPISFSPLFYLETSPNKYQAFFKLSEPATVKDIDAIQKKMAWILGDKAAGSFYQHRRMPGLCNGKYEDDPVVLLILSETPSLLSLKDIPTLKEEERGVAEYSAVGNKGQKTEGQDNGQTERVKGFYIRPVVPADYQLVAIDKRETDRFLKKKDDGTIDDSAIDMAWATHIARMTFEAGWDDMAIGFTIYDLLLQHSPEIQRRKGSPKHVREYLFRTAWKALKEVKRTPSEPPKKEEEAPDF
jgi:hypothetical protein